MAWYDDYTEDIYCPMCGEEQWDEFEARNLGDMEGHKDTCKDCGAKYVVTEQRLFKTEEWRDMG